MWRDGSVYEGYYHEGKKEGFGNFNFALSANQYEGFWKDGKRDGLGILTDKVGIELKKGKWEKGEFVKSLNKEEWEEKRNYGSESSYQRYYEEK